MRKNATNFGDRIITFLHSNYKNVELAKISPHYILHEITNRNVIKSSNTEQIESGFDVGLLLKLQLKVR